MMEPLRQLNNRSINTLVFKLLISFTLVSLMACTLDEQKVTVVLSKLENSICVLKLDTQSKTNKDTVYLSEDGIGVLSYSDPYTLYGDLFEIIYFDENGKKVRLDEWIPNKKYINQDQVFFQHGLFMSRNDVSLLVFLVGNLEYLNKDFDIKDSTFISKIDMAIGN